MDTPFAKFLQDNKIDSRRLIVASRQVERRKLADRIALRARTAEKAARSKKSSGDEAPKVSDAPKLPTGRPITQRLVSEASAGKKLSKHAKARLLRAVNRLLEQRKQPAVEFSALFASAPVGKS